MKRAFRKFLTAMITGLVIGAFLGGVVAVWGKADLFGGIGIGAFIGVILGFAALTIPKPDREPKDLFPQ